MEDEDDELLLLLLLLEFDDFVRFTMTLLLLDEVFDVDEEEEDADVATAAAETERFVLRSMKERVNKKN